MNRTAARIWFDDSPGAVAARVALAPAEWLYRGAVAVRNALYDRDWLRVHEAPIPAVSIGNLAVGGTGKTPVAAWFAAELQRRGARPAIVMRGYGADEPLVHARLNPSVPVFTGGDRVRGLREARAAGCDVAVMDDAFQHRRVRRIGDVVLVSADRWTDRFRLLPAGPGREPLRSLRRASLVVVTRKATGRRAAAALASRLEGIAAGPASAVAHLAIGPLVDFMSGAERPLASLHGARIVLASGVGDPGALEAQLLAVGAAIEARSFPDHHVYDSADMATLVSEGSRFDGLVCTLKDAVKLGPAWPRGAGPLWYVSQRCEFEDGGAGIAALLDRLLTARTPSNN